MRTSTRILLGAATVVSITGLFGAWSAFNESSPPVAIERDAPPRSPGLRGPTERDAPPRSPGLRGPTERDELEAIIEGLQIEYTPPVARRTRAAPLEVSRLPTLGRVEDVALVEQEAPAVEPVLASAQDAMRRALRQKRPLLEHCFNQELKKQASFDGFLVLRVSVAVDGRVTAARVEEGNARDRLVAGCMIPHLRSLRLPPVQSEADLLLPIRLHATAPAWPPSHAASGPAEGS